MTEQDNEEVVVTRTITWSYKLPVPMYGDETTALEEERQWDLRDHIIALSVRPEDKVVTSVEFRREKSGIIVD